MFDGEEGWVWCVLKEVHSFGLVLFCSACLIMLVKQPLKFIIHTIRCMTKLQSKQLRNNRMIFSAIAIPILREIMLFQAHT